MFTQSSSPSQPSPSSENSPNTSNSFTPPQHSTDTFQLSDEVHDIIATAHKLAKKRHRGLEKSAEKSLIAHPAQAQQLQQAPQPQDRDYLNALLINCRMFSRTDALFKALGHSASHLYKQFQNRLRSTRPGDLPPHEETLSAATTTGSADQSDHLYVDNLLTRASRYVFSGKHLEAEHLLMALSHSAEEAVREVLEANQVTEPKINEAMIKAQSGTVPRLLLFFSKELVELLLIVLISLIAIKEGFGEIRLIPSESMVPNLQINDRIFIEKVSRWGVTQPLRPFQRGDILVFYPPMTQLPRDPVSVVLRLTGFSGLIHPKEDNIDVAYIKRLIGLPGDKIEVRPGDGVYINDELIDEPYVNEIAETCTQVLANGQICGPIRVPQDAYFMMGDNRNHSADSRYWGFAPKSRVIGRAVFRIWPLDRFGELKSPRYSDTL